MGTINAQKPITYKGVTRPLLEWAVSLGYTAAYFNKKYRESGDGAFVQRTFKPPEAGKARFGRQLHMDALNASSKKANKNMKRVNRAMSI